MGEIISKQNVILHFSLKGNKRNSLFIVPIEEYSQTCLDITGLGEMGFQNE